MTQSDDDSTRAHVFDLIAGEGLVSVTQLAKVLSLTPTAVCRHIIVLGDTEQIEVHTPAQTGKRGRGRPAQHYVLTPRAHTSFTEGYFDLANRTLRCLSQVVGDRAVDSFAAARGRDLKRYYATVVEATDKDPLERARALVDILTLDGHAAPVHDVGDGFFAVRLCRGDYPVRNVVGKFRELCNVEAQAISRLVDIPVQRLAILARSEHVCITHIPTAMPALCKHVVRAVAKT